MSGVSEPAINGKVILKTTLGDIEIELWSKETPLASRNFVQLCMEGYYDGCIFHRVVKDFIAQTGDPTGTGTGGESIYPERIHGLDDETMTKSTGFKDEFHSRLRFNRRGIVGMASSLPDQNKSQFFFTLSKAENLTKKHTVFGRIVGDTLFNLLKVNEIEVDTETDIPLFPPKIISTEVVWNPFTDIIPRQKVQEKRKIEKKKHTKKNLNLLSFGDEEENDEENDYDNSIKKNTKINNNSSANNGDNSKNNNNDNNNGEISKKSNDGKSFSERMKEELIQKGLKRKEQQQKEQEEQDKPNNSDKENNDNNNNDNNNITTSINPNLTTTTTTTNKPKEKEKKKKIKGSLQFKTSTPSSGGVPKKSRLISETDILKKLNTFKNTLNTKASNNTNNINNNNDKNTDDNGNDDDDETWTHQLKFSKKSKLEYE